MQRHACTQAPSASRPSASSKTQSIQSAQSGRYINWSRGSAAGNHLRVEHVGSVHGDFVFVNRELRMRFCFWRFGVPVVEPLLRGVERRFVVLELDDERSEEQTSELQSRSDLVCRL